VLCSGAAILLDVAGVHVRPVQYTRPEGIKPQDCCCRMAARTALFFRSAVHVHCHASCLMSGCHSLCLPMERTFA
jgi:hypothetical protein